MSTRRRGRITVQSQPTGAARGMQRLITQEEYEQKRQELLKEL